MKTRQMITTSALIASLFCLPAIAQTGPGMGDGGMGSGMQQGSSGMMKKGPGARGPRDCSQSRNPEACTAHREARTKANEACKTKVGPDRKQCMIDQRQNFDCSKAVNPQQCEARKVSYKECQNQTGPAFRQCVQQKMPAPDCSKSNDPKRCEIHQKARAACKDKVGPEHKSCLREQFNVK